MQLSNQVFITGGTGLIGTELITSLIKSGYKVVATKRPSSMIPFTHQQLKWVEIDVLDIVALEEEIQNCEVVIHTAALVSFSPSKFEAMYQTNVEGTKNIVNLCLKHNKRLIHISSVAALGRGKESEITENSTWSDSDINSYYAKTKYLSELEVWRGIEEGLLATIFCPSVVLAVGNLSRSSSRLFKYVLNENKFYTTGNLNYIDVNDIVNIILKNISSPIFGQRFILNGGAITYHDFFKKLATRLNKKPPNLKVTPLLAAIVWRISYLKSIITKEEPLITKETAKLSQSTYVFLSKKAEIAFKHQFIDLDMSLDGCCKEIIEKHGPI